MEEYNKSKKFQVLKLSVIALLLVVTTLHLSTSLAPAYLYFITNVLILVVGAEAGLLSFFLKPPGDKYGDNDNNEKSNGLHHKDVDKRSSDKVAGEVKEQRVKKSRSTPSMFFIAGGSGEVVGSDDSNGGEELLIGDDDEAISGRELSQKVETFIGNFYRQLKMQREESWKKLHQFIVN